LAEKSDGDEGVSEGKEKGKKGKIERGECEDEVKSKMETGRE
jgi:hypothetical protein